MLKNLNKDLLKLKLFGEYNLVFVFFVKPNTPKEQAMQCWLPGKGSQPPVHRLQAGSLSPWRCGVSETRISPVKQGPANFCQGC